MSQTDSIEIEFVAPEAEITLEGRCMHDSTGAFRILTLPDEGSFESMADSASLG
jgi:hypothetical protein